MHLTSTAIEIDGFQLQALTSDGDPAHTHVLVHGLGVASSYFEPLATALAEAGRLVLLNLPGFGATPCPDDALRIGEFAALARRVAEELGVEDAVWIGHSMGTQVVVEAEAQQSGLMKRMVLLSPVVNKDSRRGRTVIRQFAQSAVKEPLSSAAASVRAFLSCGPGWMFEVFPSMLAYPIEERIAETAVETLIVAGEHDLMAPRSWLEELASRAGGPTRVAVVPGSHQAMHSHAAEVAELIVGHPLPQDDPKSRFSPVNDPESRFGVSDEPESRFDGSRQPEVEPAESELSERVANAWTVLRDPRSVRVAAGDWAVALRDQLYSLRPHRACEVAWDADCDGPAVVLLPGILENARYLAPLAQWLAARGHVVHQLPALGWNLRGLQESVDKGFEALDALGVEDAVIVAHSKGGLIGKAMLLDPRSDGVLTRMVAVATPFNGSPLWDRAQRTFALRRSPLGMFHPEHPELATLISEREVNSRIVSLSPAFDQMIPGGSYLEGATNEVLEVEGHFRAVSSPSAWEVIHRYVDAHGS
ncbi:MAG: alpha/beta fold hydrolase [Propionibacteriaceae bacterium]|nr:alpha/beta fold hydrolase [Propionibacteriaceae bacterium]